jgi:hypothetical protein
MTTEDRLPNYLEKVLELMRVRPWPHTIIDIIVRHDDFCAHWRGGVCDCEPEVVAGSTWFSPKFYSWKQ